MTRAMDAYDNLTLEFQRLETGLGMLDDEIADLDGLLSAANRDPKIGRSIGRLYFLRNSMTAYADALRAAADEMREATKGDAVSGEVQP